MTNLETLLKAYVALHQLHASPGEKSHKLWHSIQWLERQIKQELQKLPKK